MHADVCSCMHPVSLFKSVSVIVYDSASGSVQCSTNARSSLKYCNFQCVTIQQCDSAAVFSIVQQCSNARQCGSVARV